MNLKLFVTVFGTVFLAELADKTQLATVLFAVNGKNEKMIVFFGAAAALVVATAIAVFAGSALSHLANERLLSRVAGAAFIVMGVWTLFRA